MLSTFIGQPLYNAKWRTESDNCLVIVSNINTDNCTLTIHQAPNDNEQMWPPFLQNIFPAPPSAFVANKPVPSAEKRDVISLFKYIS